MELAALRGVLEREFDYPVARETLIERIGDAVLESPAVDADAGAERVETVLHRTDETSYASPHDAYATVVGSLGEAYVGRKYYDNRGGERSIDYERPDGGPVTL